MVLHKSTENTFKSELRVNGFNSSMTETQRNEQNEVTNFRNSSLSPVELNMSCEDFIDKNYDSLKAIKIVDHLVIFYECFKIK